MAGGEAYKVVQAANAKTCHPLIGMTEFKFWKNLALKVDKGPAGVWNGDYGEAGWLEGAKTAGGGTAGAWFCACC